MSTKDLGVVFDFNTIHLEKFNCNSAADPNGPPIVFFKHLSYW